MATLAVPSSSAAPADKKVSPLLSRLHPSFMHDPSVQNATDTSDDELAVRPEDDPRHLYPIGRSKDVLTDLFTDESVDELHKGQEVFLLTGGAKPAVKPCFAVVDEYNHRLSVFPAGSEKKLKKKKAVRPLLQVSIGKLREVRDSHNINVPEKVLQKSKLDSSYADRLIVCVYGSGAIERSFVHFVAPSEDVRKTWTTGFRALIGAAQGALDATLAFYKISYLHMEDKEPNKMPVKALLQTLGATSANEKAELVERLHVMGIELNLKKTKTISTSELPFRQFVTLQNEMMHRADIAAIFRRLCAEAPDKDATPAERLSVLSFAAFLTSEQGRENVSKDQAAALLALYNPDAGQTDLLTLDGFTNYLSSRDNHYYSRRIKNVYQPMNLPLSHYFVDSSHNTYLAGHQLTGESTAEMYIQVLLEGCRCVEIDCWDGPNGETIVTHGHTLCTSVPFVDVLRAIHKYAFVTSPYPVILSIENHCSIPQQDFMAAKFKELLGEYLLDSVLDRDKTWDGISPNLPSPEQLKFKILVKNKKRPEENATALASTPIVEITEQLQKDAAKFNSDGSTPDGSQTSLATVATEESLLALDEKSSPDIGGYNQAVIAELPKNVRERAMTHEGAMSGKNISPKLSALVIYTEAVKFRSFLHSRSHHLASQMSSFPSPKAEKIIEKYGAEWVKHNIRQFSRIYPGRFFIDSQNYLPHLQWAAGNQLVALNYQTSDLGMQLNRAMFGQNGRTGYVLKPRPMRFATNFNPNAMTPIPGVEGFSLRIEVISAQHLSAATNIAIEVSTYGLPTDTRTFTTERATPNKLRHTANWTASDANTFIVDQLRLPELVMVRFAVMESSIGAKKGKEKGKQKKKPSLGQRTLPFAALQPGYRHIPLVLDSNAPIITTLFVRVVKTSLGVTPGGSGPRADRDSNSIPANVALSPVAPRRSTDPKRSTSSLTS